MAFCVRWKCACSIKAASGTKARAVREREFNCKVLSIAITATIIRTTERVVFLECLLVCFRVLLVWCFSWDYFYLLSMGPPPFPSPAITDNFPKHSYIVSKNKHRRNVKGFWFACDPRSETPWFPGTKDSGGMGDSTSSARRKLSGRNAI